MRTVAILFLAAALLSGCGSNPTLKSRTFAFAAPTNVPAATARTNLVALKRVAVSPLFQSRSFTYRLDDNTYEHDPYADFVTSPERAIAEPIREWMQKSGALGRFVDTGSELAPNIMVEVSVNQLCADYRKSEQPVAVLEIHFLAYETSEGTAGRILLDKTYTSETPLARKSHHALMAAWDTGLRQILDDLNSDYAKSNPHDGR